jgi:hypothetical protein
VTKAELVLASHNGIEDKTQTVAASDNGNNGNEDKT